MIKKLSILFFLIFFIGCAPRVNIDRFDLIPVQPSFQDNKERKFKINLCKPDDSSLERFGDNDTLLRKLEIPDISPIINYFVTPTIVSDWCADAFYKTFINYGYEVCTVTNVQSKKVDEIDINIKITGVRVGFTVSGFAGCQVVAGAKIDTKIWVVHMGQTLLDLEVNGVGDVEYSCMDDREVQGLPSLSLAMMEAMKDVSDITVREIVNLP